MIYAKIHVNDDLEMRVGMYGDEFYSLCPDCGKEVPVELGDLADTGFDLAGSSVYCAECSKKRHEKKEEA